MDIDTKERLKVIFIFLLQSYKVLMGSMLVVFVPQLCNEKICTIMDNLNNKDNLHHISLIINYITTISFTICYTIELKRENWCVEHLDIDDNIGYTHLPFAIKKRPELKKQLQQINNYYYYSSYLTTFIYIINFIISTISIYFHNAGNATITAYSSFVILILMKLKNALYISKNSKKNNMALSAYMTELKSFNVIDKDHRKTKHQLKIENYRRHGLVLSQKRIEPDEEPIAPDLSMI
jgi:hypothetical protein